MSWRRLFIVGLAVGLAYSCVALGYTCFALPPIQPHQGDGIFEDLSRRAGIFPITGYSIRFTEFDLGRDYEASFRLSHVPNIGKKCGVYLAIRDPDDYWFFDSHIRQLQQGKMQLELLDSRGAIVVQTGGKLKGYTWYGCRDLHGLYRSNESFFTPRTDEEYTLRIVYHPDLKLASYKGFGYLLCGGSK
jgi:hypothetical protein